MQKMTSAYANKVLKKLNDDKAFYIQQEHDSYSYVAADGEEPVIPEYDFEKTSKILRDIDNKIVKIKHALNVTNSTNSVVVGEKSLTIDEILVRMAQLNNRKATLDMMRKQQAKSRVDSRFSILSSKKPVIEYQYMNYDIELVKKEYDAMDAEIAAMQMARDKYNQTVEFDVDI